VLPFVNASASTENEYLSDGITDELINALSMVESLRVASRTSVFALKGRALDVRAIGALLGVAVVLEGSVRRQGEQLRVTAQLTATDDGRLLWSQRYDRQLQDVFAMQDELARTIVTTLRANWLTHFEEPSPRRRTANVAAYSHYLHGRWALNQRTDAGTHDAIAHFERAIAEDSGYALAYTGLADAYALHVDYRSVPASVGFERAVHYAREALRLDEGLAEAHTSLAWALFIYFWEWEAAGREFRRALELDPRYPTAHQWYGFYLMALGRVEEALIEGHTAQELDPASVSIRRAVGWLYFYARRYDRAEHHLARAIEMNPTSEENFRILGLVQVMAGRFDDGVATLREASNMAGTGTLTTGTLAYALDRAGHRAEGDEVRRALEARHATEYVSATSIAIAYLASGNTARALDWIERAHAERRGWVAYLQVNPIMDPVRDTPRFQALLQTMAVPGR
jgi:TolB-like protein/Flp pilus assembly protein TadD